MSTNANVCIFSLSCFSFHPDPERSSKRKQKERAIPEAIGIYNSTCLDQQCLTLPLGKITLTYVCVNQDQELN